MSKTIKEQVLEHISQYPDGLEEHVIQNYIGGDFHGHEVERALEELRREGKIGIAPKTYFLVQAFSSKNTIQPSNTDSKTS